jgi:hypothetical protein
MNVGHRGDPLEYERELRRIQELLSRCIFEGHAFGPSFDRHAVSDAITSEMTFIPSSSMCSLEIVRDYCPPCA